MQLSTLQMQALDRAQVQHHVCAMAAHLSGFAPQASASMGPDRLRETVATGLARAARHGFDQFGSARFYLELMFMFGRDFDTDPQYPWFADVLGQAGAPGGLDRADRLHAVVVDYVDEVSGPGHRHEAAALARAALAHAENVVRPDARARDVATSLRVIYPEKCRRIGDAAVAALVDEAFAQCERRGPSWEEGRPLVACLMFAFGHGCLTDPQYPWIAATLAGSPPATGAFERLFGKAASYFAHARQRLEAPA